MRQLLDGKPGSRPPNATDKAWRDITGTQLDSVGIVRGSAEKKKKVTHQDCVTGGDVVEPKAAPKGCESVPGKAQLAVSKAIGCSFREGEESSSPVSRADHSAPNCA